mgnify:CR=1 FL=1
MSDEDNPKAVPAAAVLEASSAMLQKQLYAIFTTPTGGLGAVFAILMRILRIRSSLKKTVSCSRPVPCGLTTKSIGKVRAWSLCAPTREKMPLRSRNATRSTSAVPAVSRYGRG